MIIGVTTDVSEPAVVVKAKSLIAAVPDSILTPDITMVTFAPEVTGVAPFVIVRVVGFDDGVRTIPFELAFVIPLTE
jgi:hypothetical protein